MVLAASFRASWQQERTRCGYGEARKKLSLSWAPNLNQSRLPRNSVFENTWELLRFQQWHCFFIKQPMTTIDKLFPLSCATGTSTKGALMRTGMDSVEPLFEHDDLHTTYVATLSCGGVRADDFGGLFFERGFSWICFRLMIVSWVDFGFNLSTICEGHFSDCFQTRTLSRKPGRWPCHWPFMPPCAMVIWMMPWWDSLVIGGSGSQVFGLVGVEMELDTGALMCFLTRSCLIQMRSGSICFFFSMDEPNGQSQGSHGALQLVGQLVWGTQSLGWKSYYIPFTRMKCLQAKHVVLWSSRVWCFSFRFG